MEVEQISVFLQDQTGRVAEVVGVLADHGIDLQALSLAEMADFGILRIIVSDTAGADGVLREAGFTVGKTPVVAVEIPDRPGGTAAALRALRAGGIDVRYLYGSRKPGGTLVMIFRFEDPAAAAAVLRQEGLRVLAAEEVHGRGSSR